MSPSPTTLVTGACGFIGSALCQHLAAAGHRVVAFDDLSRGHREYLPEGVPLIQADIRDQPRLIEALEGSRPDGVIHLAAMHFVPDCVARPQETLDINVNGTRLVLDACRRAGVGRVILASSAAVYAPVDAPCVEDVTPLRPIEVYGESKLAAEHLLESFHREAGIHASVVRIANAVGRRETNPHVVPHIFESLQKSDKVALGSLEPRRDYIDTRDLAAALLAVLNAANGFQVFNIGTGIAHSVVDIIDALRRILGRAIVVVQESGRLRPVERMLLVSDITRIQRVTGWKPRITFEDSLRDLVDAYGL